MMKRSNFLYNLLLTIFFMIFMGIFSISLAGEKEKFQTPDVITAAVLADFPPLYQIGPDGEPDGFAIDILEHVAEQAKFKINFIILENWVEAMQAVRTGDADLIPGIGISPARAREFLFTEKIETIPVSCFVRYKNEQIKGISSLKDYQIAVINQSAAMTRLQKDKDFNLLPFQNIDSALMKLLSGDVDAFVFPEPVLWKKARNIGLEEKIKVVGKPLMELQRGFLLHKDNSALKDLLDPLILSYTQSNPYLESYARWYGKPTPYWSAKKIFWAMIVFIVGILLIFFFWHWFSISRVNKKLRKSVQNLEESEEKYRRLTENAKDMIYRMSLPEGNYEYVSPASIDLMGYTPQEFYATPTLIQEVIHPDWIDYFTEQWKDLISGHMPPSYEYQIIHKSGKEKWMYQRNVLILDEEDNPVAIEGIVTDVTHRKIAEQKLKKSQQELQTVLSSTPVGLGLVIDRKLNWGNATMYQMFGYEQGALLGKSARVLYPDKEEYDRVGKLLYTGISGSGVGRLEARCIKKDGTVFNALFQIAPVDKSDPAKGHIASMLDLTDQKQAEKDREKLQDQLIQAQKMESVGRLAGGVAHDFNNMLSIILGNTELLMEDLKSKHLSVSNLEEIDKAARRSSDLTRQLLAFARKQTISPKVLNLNNTIEGMLQMLRRLIGENIDLSWHPANNLWSVKIDPSQIDQILANLCVNARDSIRDVGSITIETGNVSFDAAYCREHHGLKPGSYIMFAVSDTGCGMDKEILGYLFEPFFTTKKAGEGTGLGLAMVYGIVKQNDGFINVYSEPEKGTTFKIYIPRYTEEIEQKETAPDKEKILLTGNETILLVEDEKAVLNMTKITLERLGYTVLAANTPDEAIQICETFKAPIHLLLTDVVMPSMNGRDLSKKILKLYPDMKCLFMSGYTANVIAHRGVLDEGVNFISKPFSRQELSLKLRDTLDENPKK